MARATSPELVILRLTVRVEAATHVECGPLSPIMTILMESQPQQSSGPLAGLLGSLIEQRSSAVSAAHSPLIFFALALSIIEVFLICAGAFFDLPTLYKVTILGAGIGVFLIVFIIVALLVWKVPQNVVFSQESHLKLAALQRGFGNEQHNTSAADLVNMVSTAPSQILNQPAAELPAPVPEREEGK